MGTGHWPITDILYNQQGFSDLIEISGHGEQLNESGTYASGEREIFLHNRRTGALKSLQFIVMNCANEHKGCLTSAQFAQLFTRTVSLPQ